MAASRWTFWLSWLTFLSAFLSLSAWLPKPVRLVLWVLLTAGLLQALPMWWLGRLVQRRRSRQALATLQQLGGLVTARSPREPFPVVAVDLQGATVTSDDWERLQGFRGLEILDLENARFDPADLAMLDHFHHLRVLNLAETNVDDAAAENLLGCHRLQGLCLRGTRVSRECAEMLLWSQPGLHLDLGDLDDPIRQTVVNSSTETIADSPSLANASVEVKPA